MKHRSFILFVTADGCSRIVAAGANWNVPPTLRLPLAFPPRLVDWINDATPPEIMESRSYRLDAEEVLDDQITRIYTYREIQ